MTIFRFRVAVGLLVATVGLTTTAAAQTNDDFFPSLEWNFSTPGARANGMGKTFIGMADDATAAITNPAGLVSLTRPQVYLEFKNTKLKVDRLAAVNSLVSLQPTTVESTFNALSFLSVSAPISDKIAVGFSVHRFLDYRETFSLETRAIPNSPGNFAFFPVAGSGEFRALSFGGSIAFQVTRGLRLGTTIAGNSFKANSNATRYRFRNDLSRSNIIVNQSSIDDTQNAISASIGALYKANDMVSLGFSYGKSPRFKTSENLMYNPGNAENLALATNQPLLAFPGTPPPFPKEVAINVPDHFGFGVSIRPASTVVIAADVVRMKYSSLTKNTTIIYASPVTGAEFETPDVTEIHFGGEFNVYNMMQKHPIFVRAGVFRNPNHLVNFTGTSDVEANALNRAKYNLLPRKDDVRGTVGVGFVFGTRFQADVAYVVGKELVASTAVRF
jgi:long-subunit fatty acid transport protein